MFVNHELADEGNASAAAKDCQKIALWGVRPMAKAKVRNGKQRASALSMRNAAFRRAKERIMQRW
jgi:hypothetical protein